MTREHWFEPLADHMGRAYLRYSFTKGTRQEIDFLIEALGLTPGMRILDVGCGPGRHAHELARRGFVVHGVDISQTFVDIAVADAPTGATFERLDARALPFRAEFDLAMSLCQGGFGLLLDGEHDQSVLAGMSSACGNGGRVALSAFNAYFQVKYLAEGIFDAATGIHHERTEVRDEHGKALETDLWTTCLTPRELRFMCAQVGLRVDALYAVEPGRYAANIPDVEHPEFLVLATRLPPT